MLPPSLDWPGHIDVESADLSSKMERTTTSLLRVIAASAVQQISKNVGNRVKIC